MKSLIENLYHNNVIFSYYGFIDESVLSQVLQITQSKLSNNNESEHTIKRVYEAIKECVDNVIKHNFYPDDARVKYKSLLVVSKHNEQYLVDTINVVNASQKESINEQLNYLHSRSQEELMQLKSRSLLEVNNPVTVSKGLVDLVLKADRCDCTFKDIDPNFLFNINYKINTLN